MNNEIKSFIKFNEGLREQEKIDELLDIASQRKLTPEETDLLKRLNAGENLPREEKPTLKMHKTGGGFVFDKEGNIEVQGDNKTKPGEEFTTVKGKTRQVDKISKKELLDARIYKNKDSEERFIYSYVKTETVSGTTTDWIIYRTGGGDKYPFGQFLDINVPRYNFFKRITPEQLWKELDYVWDYGMVLDEDLYEDFKNFIDLYKQDQVRNRQVLIAIRNRFLKLL